MSWGEDVDWSKIPKADPSRTESGASRCNEPLVILGLEVAYCQKWVWPYTRGLFRKVPPGEHRGNHRMEW